MAELRELVIAGPDHEVHKVIRWRCVDLCAEVTRRFPVTVPYIFGAICPERGVGAAIITPAANMECLNVHLAEISMQVAPGSIAAVICDRTGWHQRGGDIKLPDNVVLLPLPSYAPELNSMENVWDYLRVYKLSARVWDDYDEIVAACADAWNWLANDPARIRSIGTRQWATVNI